MKRREKIALARIGCSVLLLGIGFLLPGWWRAGFMLAAWLISGYDVLWDAVRNIFHGQFFDENFLMGLATVCAVAMQDWAEAAGVMILFQIGELFEHIAVERSRKSISSLMDLRPDRAVVLRDGKEVEVEPEEVCAGELLLVRPGERIPVDGEIVEGESSLDTSNITGESLPAEVQAGERVVSGSVNLTGVLKIRAESAYEHSTVARILALAEQATEKKAASERLITRFSRYYTPSVIAAAVLLAAIPPLAFGQPFTEWLSRALSFLVISCPCALVISVPLSFFSGMGAAAKLGIIVKGGSALEGLCKAKTIVFDKTGTLTKGEFSVREVVGENTDEVLRIAARCEQYSNHPIAHALREALPSCGTAAENISETAGNGITATVDGASVAVGNRRLMEQLGVEIPTTAFAGTAIYVAREGKYLGTVVLGDTLREGTPETIRKLHAAGLERAVMLTGDREETAAAIAKEAGLDEFHAQLLPQDKVTLVEQRPESVIFVGDGVNDAPVLTVADVGIAMGGVGSDAAVEAADAVLLKDDLSRLPSLLHIARKTCRIAKENIAFALGVKGICLILGALGYAPMWLAIFADVGVAMIAILNSLRALRQ